jgi:hypothetical protein
MSMKLQMPATITNPVEVKAFPTAYAPLKTNAFSYCSRKIWYRKTCHYNNVIIKRKGKLAMIGRGFCESKERDR